MHSCSRAVVSTSSSQQRGTPRLVASILHEDYPCQLDTPTPNNIISIVQGRADVQVSYNTALRGKKLHISDVRGSPEESYKKLPSYMYMLEIVNPGTVTSVELDAENRFKFLFIALGTSIEGFKAMRKVLVVDATFLKTVYGGMLVFALAQDPDHHHYPIAFGVIDGENDISWTWFMEKLKSVIPDVPGLVFMSDRNSSIIKADCNVYPKAVHGHCVWHLSQNVRDRVKDEKDEAAKLFRKCAHIYTVTEFNKEYGEFRRRFEKAGQYLDKSIDFEKWARCHFKAEKYNIDTSNSCESTNGVLRRARKYALLPMIDAIVEKISKWFNKHRQAAAAASDSKHVVPFVDNLLNERCAIASHLTVNELNSFQLEYNVIGVDGETYLVDLRMKTCSCRCFDIDKYPCVHAIAACKKLMRTERRTTNIEIHDLCSKYYSLSTWALVYCRTICSVPHESSWSVLAEIHELFCLPPP